MQYELEPNDIKDNASIVFLGDPITGVTADAADDDWYVFDASAPGLLSVDLSSMLYQGESVYTTTSDYYNVIAYDADQNILSSRRGSGSWIEGGLSFTVAAPTSGLYYIVVENSTYHTTEPYDLTVNFTEGSLTSFTEDYETEENHFIDTNGYIPTSADAIAFGKDMNGSLYDQHDADYYKLDVTEQGVINVTFDYSAHSPSYYDRFAVNLWDSVSMGNGSGPIVTEYAGANGEGVDFDFAVTDPSLDYYLVVRAKDSYNYEDDPYTISTTFTQGIDGYETESNDTAAEADSVILGDPITGVTADAADDDWYVFDASAPGLLSVDLSSMLYQGESVYTTTSDYYNVIAYDADQNILSSRRGSGSWIEGGLSFTVAAPTSGLYYIVVENSTYHTTEPYDLTVNFTEGSLTSFTEDYETEENHFIDTNGYIPTSADAIAFGKDMNGSLYDQHDADYYKLDVTEQGVINVTFDYSAHSPSYYDRFAVNLWDSVSMGNGSGPIVTEYAGANGEGVDFDFAVTDPSLDYYLVVRAKDSYNYEDDPYTISTTFTQGIDGYETESNDTAAEADSVILGDPITGVTADAADDDWYVFDASAPGLLSVDLSSMLYQGESVYTTTSDYYNVIAYDADQNILSSRRGSGSWIEGGLSFTVAAPTSGLYYIVVENSTYHTTEPYDLTVNFTEGSLTSFTEDYETEENHFIDTNGYIPTSADAIAFGKDMNGSLYDQHDADYYKLDVTEQGVINVTFDYSAHSPSYYDRFAVNLWDSVSMGNGSGPIVTEYAGANGEGVDFDFAVTDPSLDYYLVVRAKDSYNYEDDPYTISTTFQTSQLADETEINDSINTADIILPGTSLNGNLSHVNDKDFYKTFLKEGEELAVDLDVPSSLLEHYKINIYNSKGSIVSQINPEDIQFDHLNSNVLNPPAQVNFTPLSDGNMAAVWAVDIWKDLGDGTWSSTSTVNSDYDIFYRVFNPIDGTFVTDEVRVTDTIESDYVESVTANDSGGFTINYNKTSDNFGDNYTYSPEESNENSYNYSHAIMDSNLVWTNGSDITITIDTTDSPGGSVTSFTDGSRVFNANDQIQQPAQVNFTPLSDGNMAAVWAVDIWKDLGDETWNSDYDIFYRVFNPIDGTFVTDEVRVTDTIESDYVESVTANDSGGFTINYNKTFDTSGEYYTYPPEESNENSYNYSHAIMDSNLVWTNGSDITITIDTTDSPGGSVTSFTDGSRVFNANDQIQQPAQVNFTPLSDGNMAAVWAVDIWKDLGDETWNSDYDIFYRVFNPIDGTFVTDEVRVTDTIESDYVESVTANDSGWLYHKL